MWRLREWGAGFPARQHAMRPADLNDDARRAALLGARNAMVVRLTGNPERGIRHRGVRRIIAMVLVLIPLYATACGNSTGAQFHTEEISKSTFKGTWPLIPDSGILACERGAVTFTPTGSNDTYAMNPIAARAEVAGWRRDSEHIRLGADRGQSDTPGALGVSMSDLINQGLSLCGFPWDGSVATDQPGRVQPAAAAGTIVELPFTGLNNPSGVAVDTAGNVYVADTGNARVLKLPARSNTQVTLPFTGLFDPGGVAVDSAGNVYVTDYGNNSALKLLAGSDTSVKLPFADLTAPTGVAVDTAGNVYVLDNGRDLALRLPAGSNTPVELKLDAIDLHQPQGMAVDSAGNIYITGYGNAPVWCSSPLVKLPFTGFTGQRPPNGVAVDSAGNVYAVDSFNQRVVELPARSTTQVELSFGTGPGNPWGGVAVDAVGNVYVADNHRVLKLPAL
jgi:DNA-binding beta-propeller fold protein YncE